MRVVKPAAVQLSPVLYSRDGTVDKVVRMIRTLDIQFGHIPRDGALHSTAVGRK